jgi:hypothetical protein
VLPENDQTSDQYWQTKEEVEAVLGAGYVKLREALQYMLIWGEVRGDGLSVNYTADLDIIKMANWNIVPENKFCKWDKFYQVINYANMVLTYAPSVVDKDPSFSESVMKSNLSEAYFLRALSYFYLVRNFRDVPLVLSPFMNDDQKYDIAKSSDSLVLNQIVADLNNALGASKDFFPDTWASKGRSTKWSIYATLADVYLWRGEYDKCIIACNEIINSKRVALILGTVNSKNNWYTIFNPGNSNEGIFEIQYNYSLGQTNSLVSWFGTNNYYSISQSLVNKFESVLSEDVRGINASYTALDFKVWKYLGSEAGGVIRRTYSDQNWIIYRMADVLLMKAEALVMKGGNENTSLAIGIVNDIRVRAGISLPISVKSSELENIDIVLDERAREFVAEGKRWYDILRVAKRDNYKYKQYLIDEVMSNTRAGSIPVIVSKLLNADSHYLPVHTDELKANSLLVQNPYYANLN